MGQPFCSVVVVNYNGQHLLARFLPFLERLGYPTYEVIVVDNASTDGSAEFVEKNYPNFKLIKNDRNLGTAEGSNISEAMYKKSDYILWLSNDMAVDAFLLQHMINMAESSSDIAICTCKMRRLNEQNEQTDIIDSVGADLDFLGFPSARGINEKDNGQLDKPCEVFFAFGGATLMKTRVLKKIGGFDEKYFTLGDDIDLCWRAHLAGYKVVVEPKALLYHKVSATLGTIYRRSQKRYLSERNTLRTLLKNYAGATLSRILPTYFALLTLEIIFFFLIRKTALAIADIKAMIWNILNLKDTWVQRKRIQQLRAVSDKDIQRKMIKKPLKIDSLKDYLKHRRAAIWRGYFGETKSR